MTLRTLERIAGALTYLFAAYVVASTLWTWLP